MEVRKSLVVNSTPFETRIALLENGRVCELFMERSTHISRVGDVYKARLAKLLPGMQSAFVSMGTPKDGFLYLDDPNFWGLDTEEEEVAEEPEESLSTPEPLTPLKEGDELLVQIIKDPIGSKGPRLSRHLSFPGRFLVFMPGINHIGISRKITDSEERERLRALIRSHAQPGEGFIVRTAAIGEKDEDLVRDVTFLRDLWQDIQTRSKAAPTPSLVYQDLRLVHRVVRDLFREEVQTFWVDEAQVHTEVVEFIQKLHPEWVDRVKHFTSDLPIFEAFGIEQEIQQACHPKVPLRQGGSIVLNQTEALVSVDVNTGKFVGKKDLEETVFLNNLEAIPEIVRQLRLRNMGGLIVLDLIDMTDARHRETVLAKIQEELVRDRNHPKALGISEFGLVEMTRKRTGPSLDRSLTQPCPQCQGTGRVTSPETIALRAYRELARRGERLKGQTVRLCAHPELSQALDAELKEGLASLALAIGFQLQWIERSDAPKDQLGFEVVSA